MLTQSYMKLKNYTAELRLSGPRINQTWITVSVFSLNNGFLSMYKFVLVNLGNNYFLYTVL